MTCFLKPKYRYKVDSVADSVSYKVSGFYNILQGAVFLLNLAWVLSLPFLLFLFSESIDGFIRITILSFIAELIYKVMHADYKYF
ncbi:hypothetical protein COJ59_14330 [Bacillus cereus]|nr:hypothetical protein COJ59_14330 [Bacillus cereus]